MTPGLIALAGWTAGATSGPASAQTVDRGTLVIMRDSDTLGIERFTVTQTTQGFEITSTAFYPPTRPAITIQGTLRLGLDSLPSVASRETIRGGTHRVVAQFDRRRMTFRRVNERGESAREFPGAPRVMVVFDSLLAFHAILPQLSDGQITVVGPANDYRRSFRLADRGDENVTVAGARTLLRHVTLTAEADVRHVWLEGGRLHRLDLTDVGIVAVRAPPETR